ncbi:hypothetical protein [Rhizobium rhizogenes]|nr:hypothetical protein [Rhizobium rhizogenes]MCZ7451774.1 hypothetical protein [Rhizobium rhizogenes]
MTSARRHPGLEPVSSAIKSLIAREPFTTQTSGGWMPDHPRA